MSNFCDDLIILLRLHMGSDRYINPHVVKEILIVLGECYGFRDEAMWEWSDSLWGQ